MRRLQRHPNRRARLHRTVAFRLPVLEHPHDNLSPAWTPWFLPTVLFHDRPFAIHRTGQRSCTRAGEASVTRGGLSCQKPACFASGETQNPPTRRYSCAERITRWENQLRDRAGLTTMRALCGCRRGGMADAVDSKSTSRKGVGVQVPPPAPSSLASKWRLRQTATCRRGAISCC